MLEFTVANSSNLSNRSPDSRFEIYDSYLHCNNMIVRHALRFAKRTEPKLPFLPCNIFRDHFVDILTCPQNNI